MNKTSLLVVLMLMLCADLRGGDIKFTDRFNLASAPRIAKAPTIDGAVDKREWYGAAMLPQLILADSGIASDDRARVLVAYDDTNLYIAFQFDRPENARTPSAAHTQHDADVWEDDSVEVVLDPGHQHTRQWSFGGNAASATWDRKGDDLAANPAWQFKAHATIDNGWEGEIAIPFASLGRKAPAAGEVWGIDVIDCRQTPTKQFAGLSYTNDPKSGNELSHLTFGGEAPVARFIDSGAFGDSDGGGAVLELVNLTSQPCDANVSIEMMRRSDASQSGQSGYLAGFLQNKGLEIILPSEDISATIKEGLARYASTQKVEKPIALGGDSRALVRVVETTPGDYLCRYTIRSGERTLFAGLLPIEISAPLKLAVKPYFLGPRAVEVRADLKRVPEWKAAAKLKFAILGKGGEKPLAEIDSPFAGKPEIVAHVPMPPQMAPGGYKLQTELLGADGKRSAILSDGFIKPADPEWFTQPAGLAPVIPPPWKPLESRDGKISALMGDYAIGKSLLPEQINVRSVYDETRVPILRAPPSLRGKINGKEIAWTDTRSGIAAAKPESVDVDTSASFENLSVRNHTTFEYDGMAKVVLDLAPTNGAAAIDDLYLDVPLTKEFSTLFQRAPTPYGMKDFRGSGAIPPEGLKHEFVFSVWLGNEERGFRWFAENWKGWHLGKNAANEAIEVLNSPDGATLRIHFFKDDKAFVLDKPRQIIFGYQFTPTRTLTPILPFHSMVYDRAAQERPANMGEIWYFKYQGWPEIYSDKERDEKLNYAKIAHAVGMKVLPYSGWYIARDSNVYATWGSEMVAEPIASGGCDCDLLCWNTAVTDAYTSLLRDRARDIDIDGFRLDAGFTVENCLSLSHTGVSQCGWYDDDGNIQPSRAIFAARKAAQRAYRVFHGGEKSDGFCIQHVHQGNRYDPILSHMDACLSVEGGETKMKTLKEFSPDFYRANVMGDAHGFRVIYLPKTSAMGYDARYGLALIHNMIPRGVPIVGQRESSYGRSASSPAKIWRALDWMECGDATKTKFFGYWKNAAYLDTGDTNLLGSFHVRSGEKMMLALLNLDRAAKERTVRIDFKKLGFNAGIHAIDGITSEDIPVSSDGAITLTFTPEGYRLVKFQSKPFEPFIPEKISENLLPELTTAKWDSRSTAPLTLDQGNIVLNNPTGKEVFFFRNLKFPKGTNFMLEAEMRVECPDGLFINPDPDAGYFMIALGSLYINDSSSISSQLLPGEFRKVRLFFTAQADLTNVIISMRNGGKAKGLIRKLEVFQIKTAPPSAQ